jgi:hypothetical protein
MFTGRLPSEHDIHTHNRDLDLSRYESICSSWDGRTAGVSSNVYASSAYGFDRIFDTFVHVPRYQLFVDGMDATRYFHATDASGLDFYTGFLAEAARHDRRLRSLLNGAMLQAKRSLMDTPVPDPIDDGARLALRYLGRELETDNEPLFGFVNLMEPHKPYSFFRGMDPSLVDEIGWSSFDITQWDLIYEPWSHEEAIPLMRQYHRATIEYATRKVLEFAARFPETTVIVTSDHGENVGYEDEGYLWGHTSSLSDGLTHVPLDVLNAPGEKQGSIDDLVSHLDLPDMVAAFGRGRMPEVSREVAPAETMGMAACTDPPANEPYWQRTRRAAWHEDGRAVRWDVETEAAPEWALNAFETPILEAHREARRGGRIERDLDAATEQQLTDLGYL